MPSLEYKKVSKLISMGNLKKKDLSSQKPHTWNSVFDVILAQTKKCKLKTTSAFESTSHFQFKLLLERDLATSEWCLAVKKAVSIMDVSGGGQNKTAPQLKIVPWGDQKNSPKQTKFNFL